MFDEHLEGFRYRRFTIRRAIEALEATADSDSNDEEIQAGHDLADEVRALLDEIVAEQDPRDLLNEARAAADRMNFANRREAIAGAATLKDVFLDLDDLACSGRLPDEWVDGFVKREHEAQASPPPKVVGLNGDGDPVCPVCQGVSSVIAVTTARVSQRVCLIDGVVELTPPATENESSQRGYHCENCGSVVALPHRVVNAA